MTLNSTIRRILPVALLAASLDLGEAWNLFGVKSTIPRIRAKLGKPFMAHKKGIALEAPGIAKGNMLPMDATFETLDEKGRVIKVSTPDIFCRKKVVVVTMPAAYSPTCSTKHLPSYLRANDRGFFSAQGVDTVAILTTDPPHTLKEWTRNVRGAMAEEDAKVEVVDIEGMQKGAPCDVVLLSDTKGEFCHTCGLELDEKKIGLDLPKCHFSRSAFLVEDGKVKLVLEESGDSYCGLSGAENMLAEGLGCKDNAVFIALAGEFGLMSS